jgi:hypothetical protein
LLAGGLLTGCTVKDNVAFLILQNQVPEENCVIPAGLSETYRGHGFLDVQSLPGGFVNPGYLFTPVAQNGATMSDIDPNDNVIVLEGADIELQADSTTASEALLATLAAADLDARTQRFSGACQPESTCSMSFPVIDAEQAAAIAGTLGGTEQITILARVTVFGRIDGSDIVSNPFTYPITLCNGCGIENVGSCDNVTSSTPVSEGGECNPLQDGSLTCCNVTGGGVRCPARANPTKE